MVINYNLYVLKVILVLPYIMLFKQLPNRISLLLKCRFYEKRPRATSAKEMQRNANEV